MKNLPSSALKLIMPFIPKDPEKALESLLPKLRYIELDPVDSPSAAQIKCIRGIEPYTNASLLDIKKGLQAGTIKIGPIHRGFGNGTMKRQLSSVGLRVRARDLSDSEMKEYGIGEDLPDYFKDDAKPED